MSGNARIFLVICTHTTRHLAATLTCVGRQSSRPDGVILTCDTDDPAIGSVAAAAWPQAASSGWPDLMHVGRVHTGEARLNQVRNNGLRVLDETFEPADHDLVVMLDGDMLLEERAVAKYRELARGGAELVVPYRVNLDQARTARLVEVSSAEGASTRMPIVREMIEHGELNDLASRHARYRRQWVCRRLGLDVVSVPKSHKPKILGGHHAVSVGRLRAVNGYDEGYVGYGFDDDDLSRRLYGLRPKIRTVIAVREIVAVHLWHPSRAPARPTDAPGAARFARRDLPVRCVNGWSNPISQPAIHVHRIRAA